MEEKYNINTRQYNIQLDSKNAKMTSNIIIHKYKNIL